MSATTPVCSRFRQPIFEEVLDRRQVYAPLFFHDDHDDLNPVGNRALKQELVYAEAGIPAGNCVMERAMSAAPNVAARLFNDHESVTGLCLHDLPGDAGRHFQETDALLPL